MIQLIIPSVINEDWNRLHAILTVLVVLYACVFVSVLIDLNDHKADKL